jgi:hypothetical protein
MWDSNQADVGHLLISCAFHSQALCFRLPAGGIEPYCKVVAQSNAIVGQIELPHLVRVGHASGFQHVERIASAALVFHIAQQQPRVHDRRYVELRMRRFMLAFASKLLVSGIF